MANEITKYYGKELAIADEIEIEGVILSNCRLTPEYEVETVAEGNDEVHGRRTLKNVKFTADGTALAGTEIAAIEAAIETWSASGIPAYGVVPEGGSAIVEIGEISVTPGKAKTFSVTSTYYPKMPPRAAA